MPASVHIPIRVRFDLAALGCRGGTLRHVCLYDALNKAATRALMRSRQDVLAPRGEYLGVHFHEPNFTWVGEALDSVKPQQTEHVERIVRATIEAALHRSGVLTGAVGNAKAKTPLTSQAGEHFDHERGSDTFRLYVLPSYKDGKKTSVTMQGKDKGANQPVQTEIVSTWIEQNWDVIPTEGDDRAFYDAFSMTYPENAPAGLIYKTKSGPTPLRVFLRRLPGHERGYYIPLPKFDWYRKVGEKLQIRYQKVSGVPPQAPPRWSGCRCLMSSLRSPAMSNLTSEQFQNPREWNPRSGRNALKR